MLPSKIGRQTNKQTTVDRQLLVISVTKVDVNVQFL